MTRFKLRQTLRVGLVRIWCSTKSVAAVVIVVTLLQPGLVNKQSRHLSPLLHELPTGHFAQILQTFPAYLIPSKATTKGSCCSTNNPPHLVSPA